MMSIEPLRLSVQMLSSAPEFGSTPIAGIGSDQVPVAIAEPGTLLTRTSLCQVIPRSQDQSKKMLSELKSHHVRYTVPFDEVWMMAPRTAQQTSSGNLNGAQCAPPSSDQLTIISFPSSHAA